MKYIFQRLRLIGLVVAVSVFSSAVTLGITTALAHGGDTDLLHSCVDDTTGATRMVGDNDTCPGGEHNVDWPKGGLSNVEVVWQTAPQYDDGLSNSIEAGQAQANCPEGKIAIGGGASFSPYGGTANGVDYPIGPSITPFPAVNSSGSAGLATGWKVEQAPNSNGLDPAPTAFAICAKVN